MTFDDTSYALDRETLRPTYVVVPSYQRFIRRLGSAVGVFVVILMLLALPVAIVDSRRRALERIFGARGERGTDARWAPGGHIVSHAERRGAKRIQWHGEVPHDDSALVIVCGPELAGEGPGYRNDHRFFAGIHAFPGGSTQLLERIAWLRSRTSKVGGRVLLGQIAVLTIVILKLWSW